MFFYVLRVLFPALLIDILITAGLRRRKPFLQSNKWAAILIPVPLYLINAWIWSHLHEGGAPGLTGVVFLVVGIAVSVIRFCLGYFLAMERWRKSNR